MNESTNLDDCSVISVITKNLSRCTLLESRTTLEKLPSELQLKIFEYLDYKTLANLARLRPLNSAATTILYKKDVQNHKKSGSKALLWAAKNNVPSTIELSLSFGGRRAINSHAPLKGNPLHYAASKGHDEVVDLLLDNGADIDAPSHDPYADYDKFWMGRATRLRPLALAIMNSHTQTAHLLLRRGASLDVGIPLGMFCDQNASVNALHVAAAAGSMPLVKFLMEHHELSIDIEDYDRRTPIHFAIDSRRPVDFIEALLKEGADPNARGTLDDSPLHRSVQSYHGKPTVGVKVITTLIDHGADVDQQNIFRQTPLEQTLFARRPEFTAVFLARGANPHVSKTSPPMMVLMRVAHDRAYPGCIPFPERVRLMKCTRQLWEHGYEGMWEDATETVRTAFEEGMMDNPVADFLHDRPME